MIEIGSEFDIDTSIFKKAANTIDWSVFGFRGDFDLVLSGRTAIDRVCCKFGKAKIKMPAYCCDSMIYPFLNRGCSVDFYDFGEEFNSIDFDVLYLNNYFGFSCGLELPVVRRLKQNGVIVIYDRTHSLFNGADDFIELADYTFCSLRKWLAIPAGAIVSQVDSVPLKTCDYAVEKYDGMVMKNAYLQGAGNVEKSAFFSKFNQFAHSLAADYRDYAIDETSKNILDRIDFDKVRCRRIANAKTLYNGLADMKGVEFMWPYQDGLSPLFVPVLVKNGERDKLRKFLIDNNVYLPAHWPKPAEVNSMVEIYDSELSLVCDQRYTEENIQRVVDLIKSYYN